MAHNKTIVLPSPGQPRDSSKPKEITVPSSQPTSSPNSTTPVAHARQVDNNGFVFQNAHNVPEKKHFDFSDFSSDIISTCIHLKSLLHVDDVEKIRLSLLNDLKVLHDRLEKTNTSADKRQSLIFILCAFVDEMVLNTPWGHKSHWSQKGMLTSFFKQAFGGEQFFHILEHYMMNPKENIGLIKVMYNCLELGFCGRYRGTAAGEAKLRSLKDRVYRELQLSSPFDSEKLSPKSQPKEETSQASWEFPIWAALSILAFILFSSYSFLAFYLDNISDNTYLGLSRLIANQNQEQSQTTILEPIIQSRYQRVMTALEEPIEQNKIQVINENRGVLIRITVGNLFQSGQAKINSQYFSLLQNVTQALLQEGEKIEVYGHTDSQKIRSLRYPSNWHLSQARAVSVRKVMRTVSDNLNIKVKPIGDTSPIESNDTAKGRAKNRRIEVLLLN